MSKLPGKSVICASAADRPFVRALRTFVWDERLSLRAVAAGVRMLSLHPDYPIDIDKFIDRCKEGKHAVRGALNELREAGYARLITEHSSQGRVLRHTWRFSDDEEILRKDLEEILKQSPLARLAGAPAKASRSQKSESGPSPDSDPPDPDFPDLEDRYLRSNNKKDPNNEKKEPISLSHAAQPTAAADERDAALARFENVKKAAKWNPQTSFSAAEAQFIKLPAEDQERAVDEAPRYERDSKGCDHRVSLNRYIRDRMFDRPKPEEPKPKGMPNGVWNEIQEAKAAKEAGPPPDPAIQWRAYIDKRIAKGGADGRRILKSQIILCLEGSRGWDRANCPLEWAVENYFPDLEHWKPYDKHYAGAL